MSTVAQPKDPRREHLRQQAILRRQRVLERISGTRALIVGGVVATTCVLVGYMDASAHTGSATGDAGGNSGLSAIYGNSGGSGSNNYYGGGSSNNYYGGGSSNYGGGSNNYGGGTPPSSSSGGGVVSGGS